MTKKIKEKNSPALRFPEFSGGWDIGTIKDFSISIIDGDRGINYPKSLDFTKSGYCLFLNAKNVTKRGFSFEELTFISQKKDIAMNKGKLKRFDIVLTTRGSIGQIGFYNENVPFEHIRINSGMVIIRSEKRASPNFLYVLFANSRVKIYIKRIAFGSAQLQLTVSSIKKIPVALPTIEEQRRIADFLSAVDNKIEQLSAKKNSLEEYKKGMMQKLFSQKLRFKDDKGKLFPDWQEKSIKDTFNWVRTNNLSRAFLCYEKGLVQNIHYGDIHVKYKANFHQSNEVVPYIKNARPKDFNNNEFCKLGDVIIADASEDYADVGKAIEIVGLTDIPLVAGLHTYIARPVSGALALGFSRYLLGSPKIRKQIMTIAHGISVLGISKSNLEKVILRLPHPEEQRKIADFLSAMDSKISFQEQHINIAREFKKSLLQQMLR